MRCLEFAARLHSFVDGELSVGDTAGAGAHISVCPACAAVVTREQSFRRLLRQQPRESVGPDLSSRVSGAVRLSAARRERRRWSIAIPALAVAATVLAVMVYPWRTDSDIVARLASTHVAYVQLESPAEFMSTDRRAVAAWVHERARLRVTVPDYAPSGIQLIGARLADAGERRVAHLLYEKGRTLLSVFVLAPPESDAGLRGTRVSYRGEEYRTDTRNGYHTVAWAEGGGMFGLVSRLGQDALLECADRLRHERAGMMPL